MRRSLPYADITYQTTRCQNLEKHNTKIHKNKNFKSPVIHNTEHDQTF